MFRSFRKASLAVPLLLVLLSTCGMPQSAAGAPASTPVVDVYFVQSPTFFDVSSDVVPVTVLLADFSGKGSVVSKMKAVIGQETVEKQGPWHSFAATKTSMNKQTFDEAWKAYQSPGAKSPTQVAQRKSLLDALKAGGAEAVQLYVPRPPSAKPGDRFDVRVEATLDTGATVNSTGLAIAQSLTAPTGWILGDTHIHSTEYSDGIPLDNIKSQALSLGHHFTYVTDHIDRIRTQGGWSSYRDALFGRSDPNGYVMVPGLEVTASDADGDGKYDGDALGFGMPVSDPTSIQNKTQGCYALVTTIQSYAGATAGVAHPLGSILGAPSWADMNAPYSAVQIGETDWSFWANSIAYHSAANRASAIAGSDAHSALDAMGAAAWLHAPDWPTKLTVDSRQSLVASVIRDGMTSATMDGALSFFLMDGQYPGANITKAPGTTVYYDVKVYAPNNGYSVQVTWDFYKDATMINSGSTPMLASGGSYTWLSISTPAPSLKTGYYLRARFDYYSGGTLQFSNYTYCGPIYIHP